MTVFIKRSTIMLVYLLLSHFLSLITLTLLPLIWWLKVSLIVLIVTSLVRLCMQYQWLAANGVLQAVEINSDNHWHLTFSDNSKKGPYQLTGSVIFSLFITLYLKQMDSRSPQSVVIVRDAVTQEAWRKLRVRLRDPEVWDR